jgi:hypothetical protein
MDHRRDAEQHPIAQERLESLDRLPRRRSIETQDYDAIPCSSVAAAKPLVVVVSTDAALTEEIHQIPSAMALHALALPA